MSDKDILRREKLSPMPSKVRDFTSSREFDTPIAKHVLDINRAHVIMLTEKGILPKRDAAKILKALSEIEIEKLKDSKYEDVHLFIESELIDGTGEETGGKIHAAKSRNDQVAAALRMELRSNILDIFKSLIDLRRALIEKSMEHNAAVMVGFTHLQHAQPITLGHHLLAHHDSLERDCQRLKELYMRVNLSPMGSCALATTTFNIDRNFMAELLGFDGLLENSVDAVSARDFAIEAIADFALISIHLSRFAEELILWSTSEFSFVKIPDEYVATSSIMPQKRNPEVAELIRARCSHIIGDLNSSLIILKGLPLSYNLDLQEVTPHLWSGYSTTLSSVEMMKEMVKGLEFNVEKLYEEASKDFSSATDIAEMLVSEYGIPFRTAYTIVGKIVYNLNSEGKDQSHITSRILKDEIERTWGKKIRINEEKLRNILNPEVSVRLKSVVGGPSPNEVARMCKERKKRISIDEDWVYARSDSLIQAYLRLERRVKELVGGELGGD